MSQRDPGTSHELRFTEAERRHAEIVVGILAPIVPVLAEALQPRTELVLHDLTRMPNTIAAIGRPITGRGIGGPPTDLGVRTFRSGSSEHLIGYRTEVDGLSLRSSSIFFRADSGKGVACLCINSDIDALRRAHEILGSMIRFEGSMDDSLPPTHTESFPHTVDQLGQGILQDAIAAIGVPVELMKKQHKMDVVRELADRGFFTLREAADIAARTLLVSRFTIYNYLNEIDRTNS